MDRKTTIGYVLILGLFLAYFYFNKQTLEDIEQQEALADSAVVEEPIPVDTVSTEVLVLDSTPKVETKVYRLENNLIAMDLANLGGIPQQVELKEFKRYDSSALILFEEGQNEFDYLIPLASGEVLKTQGLDFEVISQSSEGSEHQIKLEADLGGGRKVVQSYKLTDGSYAVDYQVNFKGFANLISPKNRYIELKWSTQIQQQEMLIDEERNNTTVYYKYNSDSDVDHLKETDSDDEKLKRDLQWISFKQKFFNVMLINNDGFSEDGIRIESIQDEDATYVEDLKADVYIAFEGSDDEIHSWQIYFGPNHYQTLKKLDVGAQKIIPLGWGIFGWVNKGLVIPVFNWLEQYFDNYGIIILCLTLLIKLLLAIPMFKVYQSSAKMRILKPELDEIKERVGDDMQKMQQEQMKLYKQAGVSPLGGCLPQLIQLPILFAMFRFFPSSIELRQEKLWWATDLSTYDSIWDFPGGFEIPFYGDHVSLFTLLMTVVTLVYTFMNSQSTAGLQGPMKYIMYLMPIMFLGFFNNYSAALSFYYLLSTSITIVQNLVIRNFFIDEDKLHKKIQENKKKKVTVKKSKLQKRLEDMAKQKGAQPPKKGSKKR
ncbi:MAG: membrane protein insertase YidC [Bacteroidia bacterium]